MWCTVRTHVDECGRAIPRWNRLGLKTHHLRTFFVRTRRTPAVRENVFLLHKAALNGCFEAFIANMNCR